MNPVTIANALSELPAAERDQLRREAYQAALNNMEPADAYQILDLAEKFSSASGRKWGITEMAALETLAAIGGVLVHGNTGKIFNAVRKHGVVRNA